MTRPSIEIRIAGPVRIVGPDGADLTPAGSKVRGLVLLLALAPGLRRSRAWLQDRLWSDRGPEQASASMRQALSELRTALGAERGCIAARSGWVGFDPERVIVEEQPEALGVAGEVPELAEGLDVRDAEFENWIRDQRLAFADRIADAPPVPPTVPPTVPPAGPPTSHRSAGRDRRRRWRLSLLVVPALALLAVAAIWAGARQSESSAPPGADRSAPSIAVLPFENLGADPAMDILVGGVSRDIVTDLSRFGDLFVIAADSSFRFDPATVGPQALGEDLGVRYLLLGSVQWLDDAVRVNARVIETETARSIWAERFDRPRDDLLRVQNEVVQRVVDVIGPVEAARGKLRNAELQRIGRLPTENLRAFDHYLRGVMAFEESTAQSNAAARVAFSRASNLDPSYAKAYAMEAWTYLADYWYGRAEAPQTALAQADALAQRALAVEPSEPYSHWAMGAVRLFQKRHDLAITSYRRAIELNPNGADLMVYLGWALVYAGEPREGLEQMEHAIGRNPYHPAWYLWDVAFGHFMTGDYASAVETLERRNPKTLGTWELLAAAYSMQGREADAAGAMARVLAQAPDYDLTHVIAVEPFARPSDLDRYANALRRAGAPERGDRRPDRRAEEGGQAR